MTQIVLYKHEGQICMLRPSTEWAQRMNEIAAMGPCTLPAGTPYFILEESALPRYFIQPEDGTPYDDYFGAFDWDFSAPHGYTVGAEKVQTMHSKRLEMESLQALAEGEMTHNTNMRNHFASVIYALPDCTAIEDEDERDDEQKRQDEIKADIDARVAASDAGVAATIAKANLAEQEVLALQADIEARQLRADNPLPKFTVDMERAREAKRGHLRHQRLPMLGNSAKNISGILDGRYMRAQEIGDEAAMEAIVTLKNKLRDIVAHPAIEAAESIEALRALTLNVETGELEETA